MKSNIAVLLWCLHLTQLIVAEEQQNSGSVSPEDLKTDGNLKDEPVFSVPFGSHESPISAKAFDDSVYYRINWLSSELPDVPSIEKTLKEETKQERQSKVQEENSLWITTAHNEKYHCYLPKMVSQPQKEASGSDNIDKMSPFQLLKPLISKEVCSYRLESYWTYELCHGRYIRQFHEESTVQKASSQEYYLGRFDSSLLPLIEAEFESKINELKKEGKTRPTVQVDGVQLPYIEINMTGGTLCDLNNKPRMTRVFY
ncbi:endoplasmic reticulum lectin 1-like protein, partial [Leptotrombidium deliense]